MTPQEKESELVERMEAIQGECHGAVEQIIKKLGKKNVTYQDATNIFIFKKLAELELFVGMKKYHGQTLSIIDPLDPGPPV